MRNSIKVKRGKIIKKKEKVSDTEHVQKTKETDTDEGMRGQKKAEE